MVAPDHDGKADTRLCLSFVLYDIAIGILYSDRIHSYSVRNDPVATI